MGVSQGYNKASSFPALYDFFVRELFIGMATTQPPITKNDRLQAVEKQIELHTTTIAQSLKSLLYDEKANTDKMLFKLCKGIAGLAITSSKRHDLVTKSAKDDLSKFVVKEMERVRKQSGLKKSDVYRDEK